MRRLIVFNYDYGLTVSPSKTKKVEDLPILRPLGDDPDSLIICPSESDHCQLAPIKDNQNGNKLNEISASLSTVEIKLKTMLAGIALKIFESLQKEMTNCEECRTLGTFPQWLLIATRKPRTNPSDDVITNNTNYSLALAKKQLTGRLRKFMGDLSLQACSPIDAIGHYSAAVSDLRQSLDMLWLAGSLEGFSTAILTLISHKPPPSNTISNAICF